MKKLASLLLALALCLPSLAQPPNKIRINVNAPNPVNPTVRDVDLDVGKKYVIEFATDDNKPPFAGKDYFVEIEGAGGDASSWRGLLLVDGNVKNLVPANLIDSVIVFGDQDGADVVTVRAVVDNHTRYKANITINKTKPNPGPNPYLEALQKGYAADQGRPEDALALAAVYKSVAKGIDSFKTGKDVWTEIAVQYMRQPPGVLTQTRYEISRVLYGETLKYYDAAMTQPQKKAYKQVATNLQATLEQIASGPTPPPGPTPPGPGPQPIPAAGLRVLVVFESSQLSKYPAAQNAALRSTIAREYLDRKAVKVGDTPEYRFYDKDTGLGFESPMWNDALKRAEGKTLPWIIISNGDTKKGFEGPYPSTTDDLMKLLKLYGGD